MKPGGIRDGLPVEVPGVEKTDLVDSSDCVVRVDDRFTVEKDPAPADDEDPNHVDGGGIEGGLPPGPWSSSSGEPANELAIQSAANKHGVTIDRNCYRRSESSTVDTNYYLNAMESQVRFARWLDSVGDEPIDVDDMMSTFETVHHVAALGESGQRRYLDLPDRMLEMYKPGCLRSDDFVSRATGARPDAVSYAALVLGELGLEGRPPGPVTFPGVPPDDDAGRLSETGSAYLYPTGGRDRLRPYFAVAAEKLESVLAAPPNDPQILETIGEYYHALVNGKPFEQINNSILMGNVNTLLTRLGFDAVPHGYIDHIAYRCSGPDFGKVFRAFAEGRVKDAPDYGLYLDG